MDIQSKSGFTGVCQAGGLAEGTNSGTIQLAVAVKYAIESIAYSKAITDNIAMTAAAAQAAGTTCLYLVQLDSAGTVSTVKGDEVLTSSETVPPSSVQWPAPSSKNHCPIGAIKVVTDGVTFTAGTTDLGASGVTDTYYDFLGGVPSRPLVS